MEWIRDKYKALVSMEMACGLHNMRGISLLVQKLSASQKRLWSMESLNTKLGSRPVWTVRWWPAS
jgi:hypothetical protein